MIIPLDWIYGLIGGVMIGLAAAVYLLVGGRIMGASGLLGGIVDGTGTATLWERAAFVFGLMAMPAVYVMLTGGAVPDMSDNTLLLVLGGLAVGFGTRMANGCTSGHGVCGLSRFSPRADCGNPRLSWLWLWHHVHRPPCAGGDLMRVLVSLAVGSLFGLGLVVSGMTDPIKVQGFLDLYGAWGSDAGLCAWRGGSADVGGVAGGGAARQGLFWDPRFLPPPPPSLTAR